MTAAMEVLYDYAQDRMLRVLLRQEDGYTATQRSVEKREEQFFATLDEKARKRLEELLDERDQMAFLEGQALFRAGFRLAVELGNW